MTRVSFLSHDIITKSPNVYPPYLYGGIGNLFPGYPPYPQRQRVTDSTSQTDSHSRSATSSQHGNLPIPRGIDIVGKSWSVVGFTPPGQHMIWSPSVCYCLERWFLTRPVHRDAWIYVQSRRLDGRNPDYVKGTWLISDLMTASYPQFHRFFSHVNRLLRRRNTSPGHSLEFPSLQGKRVGSRLLYE
jgi:hypothetical protein